MAPKRWAYEKTELDVSKRVSASKHVFERLGLAIMSRLALGP